MSVRLRYFAWVRERIGVEQEHVPLEATITVAALVDRLILRGPGHAAALADRSRIRAAVNEDFVGWDGKVQPGDEVALFPPVTGG